jgi:hypothetical protein
MDFTPVGLLWTLPFRLLTCARQKPTLLPARESLWSNRRSIPAGISYSSKGSSRPDAGVFRLLEASIFGSWKVSKWVPHRDSPDVRHVKGDRVNGLKLSIDDFLPAIYGCTKVNLGFRPSDGLSWELTFKEEQLHSGSRSVGAACFQRRLVNVVKILGFGSPAMVASAALMLWFSTYYFGIVWFPDLFHITTSEGIRLSTVLFLWPLAFNLFLAVRNDFRKLRFLSQNHQCRLANS